MSQTVPVEVVGRTYWAYVASAMADGLTRMLRDGAGATVIPKRVYTDAQKFFRIALEAAEDTVPKNPSASIANYIIAAEAARGQHAVYDAREKLKEQLEQYDLLLKRLANGDTPLKEEQKSVDELCRFFAQLHHEAEAEAYDRAVSMQFTQTGHRML